MLGPFAVYILIMEQNMITLIRLIAELLGWALILLLIFGIILKYGYYKE
jgi:hypothetical protein